MSTRAYVDLMFAWGHARLGNTETARQLVDTAKDRIRTEPTPGSSDRRANTVRAWLLDAFAYRVQEALDDRAHGSPWPAALADRLVSQKQTFEGQQQGHIVNRLRGQSRILEPLERVDPYLPWKKHVGLPLQPIQDLLKAGQIDLIARRFHEMCQTALDSDDPIRVSHFYDVSLRTRDDLAGRLADDLLDRVESFAANLLTRRWFDDARVPSWFSRHRSPPSSKESAEEHRRYEADRADPGRWVENHVYMWASGIFESALIFAEAAGREDRVGRLADWYIGLYTGPSVPAPARRQFGRVVSPVCRVLMRLNRREYATVVGDRIAPERIAADLDGGEHEPMIACLGLAALDYWLGRGAAAEWVLEQTRLRLPRMATPVIKSRAMCDYADAAALTDWPSTLDNLRRLAAIMPRVPNGFTTAMEFSRMHLEVADHVVRAVTTADPAPPTEVLRAMPAGEIAARRQALLDLRAKLVEWGQPDWDPPATQSH